MVSRGPEGTDGVSVLNLFQVGDQWLDFVVQDQVRTWCTDWGDSPNKDGIHLVVPNDIFQGRCTIVVKVGRSCGDTVERRDVEKVQVRNVSGQERLAGVGRGAHHRGSLSRHPERPKPGLRMFMSGCPWRRVVAVPSGENPITNAVTEGLNSKIQAIKANARGFRSFLNYRTRILFFCGKLDLYPQ